MAKKPWNPQQAAFWLIAAVIAVHAMVVLGGTAACLMHAEKIITGEVDCDPHNRLMQLLAAALAAALAFAGVRGRDKDD